MACVNQWPCPFAMQPGSAQAIDSAYLREGLTQRPIILPEDRTQHDCLLY